MFFVYVLRSETTNRHYVGFTTDLTQRVGQHNSGLTKSTKGRGTWILDHQEQFATRAEAMRRERWLKTGKGREELKQILASCLTRLSPGAPLSLISTKNEELLRRYRPAVALFAAGRVGVC